VRRPGPALWFVLAAVVVVVVLALVGRNDRGGALDPRGTRPEGARAVVELAEALGGEPRIVTGVPPEDADTALVLLDTSSEEEAARLLDWARGGGRLVVADPSSSLVPAPAGFDGVAFDAPPEDWLVVAAGVCDIEALTPAPSLLLPSYSTFAVPGDDGSCYGSGASAYVVERRVGDGVVVAVGGPELFLNRSLAAADNAVLAAALLVPEPGTRFVFVEGFVGTVAGSGEQTLWELVAPGVRWGLLLLLVAGVVFGLGRARRLGRPVEETVPVELRGAELVVAVGNVLERSRQDEAAAARIRADARARIAVRHGLPADTPSATLVVVVAERHGLAPEEVAAALEPAGPPPDLLTTVAAVDRLERRVLDRTHEPVPVPPPDLNGAP
jgi:hypothetical protein